MKLPMFLVEDISEVSCRFWCPHCRKYHIHGNDRDGHRNAHCNLNSPLYKEGYIIRHSKKRSQNKLGGKIYE